MTPWLIIHVLLPGEEILHLPAEAVWLIRLHQRDAEATGRRGPTADRITRYVMKNCGITAA